MSHDTISAERTAAQRDRACGALLGTAAGDALAPTGTATTPGEWGDGTAMAVAIAEIAATGATLHSDAALGRVVDRWRWWAQTTGRPIGAEPLARTAPVALAYLDDEHRLAATARVIGELTHHDADAGDACVLWCAAIRHAVLTGRLDVRIGLHHLENRDRWAARLDEAEHRAPGGFGADGGVIAALQGAWSAITHTPVPHDAPGDGVFRVDHLRLALDAVMHTAGNTCAAGALLGAAYGASAVPARWRMALYGWPGLRTRGLIHLAERITGRGDPAPFSHPYHAVEAGPPPRQHPHDPQVWLSGLKTLTQPRPYLPDGVDAVVSLCPIGDATVPAVTCQLDVRLGDGTGGDANLDFVLLDTVQAIEALRADGRTLLIHGVRAVNRTPAVAALYGARRAGIGIDDALRDVAAVLSDAVPDNVFRAALHRLHPDADHPERRTS